jgi:hypothetical protein
MNYSNPLPDNSTGSKIRPFQCSKDESGRPNAMEIVAMNQGKLSGGVVKDYRYARKILDQRARDSANLDLEAQGLPPQGQPMFEMSRDDSLALELNQLLQNITSSIDEGRLSDLTVNELKNVPRLLIQLLPTMTPQEAVELIRFMDDDILEELINLNPKTAAGVRVERYFTNVRDYIKDVVPFLGLDRRTAQVATVRLAKDYFGRQIISRQEEQAILAEGEAVAPPGGPGGDDGGDEDEGGPPGPGGDEEEEEEAPPEGEDEEEEEEDDEEEEGGPVAKSAAAPVNVNTLDEGMKLPSGRYPYQITAKTFKQLRNMVYGPGANKETARKVFTMFGVRNVDKKLTSHWRSNAKKLVESKTGYRIDNNFITLLK